MSKIAEQLRRAIRKAEKRGVTQNQIAVAAGISGAQITRLMQGEREPNLDTTEKLAGVLGYKLRLIES